MKIMSMFRPSARAKARVRREPVLGADILANLVASVPRFEQQGFEIADDCVNNWLRQGRSVTLAEISAQIRAKYRLRSDQVENGFLKRMLEYVGSREIGNVADGGDVVLVHNDLLRS